MNNLLFDLDYLRLEISFKSFDELRSILFFYQKNNLRKINIPCKNLLKKEFLLNSIMISREEFPNIDIIPHFSILHEFNRNRLNTQNSFNEFLQVVNCLGCKEVLLISGSQKRVTLDSVSTLSFLKDNPKFSKSNLSIGVAFNPYLPGFMFDEEIIRLDKKLKSGLVNSIWIQFGTDIRLLESRIKILKNIILSTIDNNSKKLNIILYGSILIPSKQFLTRFKFRPWKEVYCSREFLNSPEFAINHTYEILKTYKNYDICPIIETKTSTEESLNSLKSILRLKS